MLLIRSEDVDRLGTVELGLAAARETAGLVVAGEFFTGRVQVEDATATAWTRMLVGILPELDLIGYKQFHRVGQDVRYRVSLFRHSDGEPLGIVDGRRITSLRTSSTAALSFAHVFGDDPVALAIVGSGEEAREGVRAVNGATKLASAVVFSPTPANRDALAAEIRDEHGVEATTAASVEEALAGANAAYVATASRTSFVGGSGTADLRLLAAVGATRPDHHELLPEVLTAASQVVVDCDDALEEPGDVIDAIAAGFDAKSAFLLGDWLEQDPPAAGDGSVVFKSIGSVEQDLVLARHLLLAAQAEGSGDEIEDVASLRVMR